MRFENQRNMSSIKKLVGQTAIYGGTTILARLLNYLLVPIHTYIFGTSQYGVVGELYAWVSLFNVILTYGMETAFFNFSRLEGKKEKCYSTAVVSLLVTSLLFAVICTVFSAPIAQLLKYGSHPEYITWLAIIISIDALTSITFAKLRHEMRAFRFAFVKITNILVNILLNLFFLILCPYLLQQNIAVELVNRIYSPEIGVGYIFIANLAASVVTILLLLPDILKGRFAFSWGLWKEMIHYAFPLLILGLAGIVNETMDRIMLKWLSPEDIAQSQVGIYSACYKISILMTIVIQAFKYAAEPFFFSKAKESDAKEVYAIVMKYFVLFCAVMFAGIMLYMDIVQFFVGAEFRVGIGVVPILLLANMFLGIFYNLSIWYKLTGQTKFGAYIALIGATITLILNYLLIPVMGYMGSAWTTFICYFVMMVLSYWWGQKHYRVDYSVARICLYIVSAVAIYGISRIIPIEYVSSVTLKDMKPLEQFVNYCGIASVQLRLLVNTCLFLIYVGVLVMIERKNFRLDIQK